jgi:hypothetical protein
VPPSRFRATLSAVVTIALVGVALAVAPAQISAHASPSLGCSTAGEQPTATASRSLVSGPEPLLDANGNAAKAWAGFYVEQAVLSVGSTVHVGYFDAASRQLTIASRTGTTGAWTFTTPVGPAGEPVRLSGDTHNAIAMSADSRGGLHLFAGMHSSPMTYWHSAPGEGAAGLTFADHLVLTPSFNAAGVRTDDEGYVTYPRFLTARDGALHVTFRSGWSDAGKTYLYSFDPTTGSWSNALGSAALLDGWTGPGYSPYPAAPVYNPADGNYYLSWTWQENGSALSTSTVSMMRSRDLRTWTTVNGTAVATPVRYGATGPLVDAAPAGSGLINGNVRVGFDATGRATVAYTRTVSGSTVLTVARRDGLNKNWLQSDVSRWKGAYDLTDSSTLGILTLGSGTTPTGDGNRMRISYSCNGQSRSLLVDNGPFNGRSVFVSDSLLPAGELPAVVLRPEFGTSTPQTAVYRLIWRTAQTTDPRGTLVLKWEAGAMIVNGAEPQPGTFPAQGSTLLLSAVE